MTDLQLHREYRQRPKAAPRPTGVRVRRGLNRSAKAARRLPKAAREWIRRNGYRGVERPPRWPRGRLGAVVAHVGIWVGAGVFAVVVLRAVWVVARGRRLPFMNIDKHCDGIGYSCGVANSILMTLLTLAFAAWLFYWRRTRRVRRPYVRRARTETRELVPTAGTIIGKVVGRDEICHVIMDDLRRRDGRRPHVVIGGVGVGKTAVLYRLTRLLAEKGAIPVPLRLRKIEDGLDFDELARKSFVKHVSTSSLSDAEAERVWRELSKDDKIVVVADGLEEAFSPEGRQNGARTREEVERDNKIRIAIREAQRRNLPLVVASRPHAALDGLDAAVVELEHLSEHAALEYIEEGASTHDRHRLDWLIRTAEVTETPLFLQIARELHAHGLLDAARMEERNSLDTRGGDRPALRLALLEAWTEALIDGHFHADVPMSAELRRATVEQLSVLACLGLMNDSLTVDFAHLLPDDGTRGGTYEPVLDHLRGLIKEARLKTVREADLPVHMDREIRLAATRGAQLRLVEPYGEGVMFPHSILQAYLGSRVIERMLKADPQYLPTGLKKASRELLVALTMYSRRASSECIPVVRDALADADTSTLEMPKQLDILVSALEIDCVLPADRRHRRIAEALAHLWPAASENRTVEETKLKCVARFGEAARTVQRQCGQSSDEAADAAYPELYEIAKKDVAYRVRLSAAQELSKGGHCAYRQLAGASVLSPPEEGDLSGEAAFREFALRAWLAPMFVHSTDPPRNGRSGDDSLAQHRAARENLAAWLQGVAGETLPLTLEVALAQGFKHAANRRPAHPEARIGARGHLAERAAGMMQNARFWYSRLTLVHALSLWALSSLDGEGANNGRRNGEPLRRASDPQALVSHWLATTRPGVEHPFVAEARELAILALEKRQPERYMWIDESGVVTKIGARAPDSATARKHDLWIAPSVGWSALHPRAQQLVADVLLLLNLIEREGDDPVRRDERMARANRDDLPPCLTRDRSYLAPTQTIGGGMQPMPGAGCCDDCHFDLCPYPPKGIQPYRVELSEAFCRRQQVLLGRPWELWMRHTARWQGATPRELKQFWRAMEERARR